MCYTCMYIDLRILKIRDRYLGWKMTDTSPFCSMGKPLEASRDVITLGPQSHSFWESSPGTLAFTNIGIDHPLSVVDTIYIIVNIIYIVDIIYVVDTIYIVDIIYIVDTI